jgi:hypothetical protein
MWRRMRKQLSSLAGVPGLVDDANASEIPAHEVRLQRYAEHKSCLFTFYIIKTVG